TAIISLCLLKGTSWSSSDPIAHIGNSAIGILITQVFAKKRSFAMLFRNWYAPGRPRSGIRGRAQFRPWLEALEDRTLPSLQAVSVSFLPPDSGAGPSDSPAVSADGRYVAFASDAPNLVPAHTPTPPPASLPHPLPP